MPRGREPSPETALWGAAEVGSGLWGCTQQVLSKHRHQRGQYWPGAGGVERQRDTGMCLSGQHRTTELARPTPTE